MFAEFEKVTPLTVWLGFVEVSAFCVDACRAKTSVPVVMTSVLVDVATALSQTMDAAVAEWVKADKTTKPMMGAFFIWVIEGWVW